MTSIFWFCALAGAGASVARLTPKLASTRAMRVDMVGEIIVRALIETARQL